MQTAPDVTGVEPGAAIAHPGVVDGLVGVASRAGDGNFQRAGDCGFLPAGIRRAVFAGIANHHPPCVTSIRTGQQAGGRHEVQPRKTGGQKVDQVIETGRGGAEVPVALGTMPDHAVEGVDGLVREEPRQSGDHIPEERRHHCIGEVFRHRFDGAANNPRLVQAGSVPAHHVAHRIAALVETLLQAAGHGAGMVVEAAEREQGACDHRLQHPAMRPALDQETVDRPGGRDARTHRHHDRRGAAEHAEPTRRRRVEDSFRELDELAEHHHRMGHTPVEPYRITRGGVDEQSHQDNVKLEAGSTHGGGIRPQQAGHHQERESTR